MCLVEGEGRGERREADCKLVAGCSRSPNILCETKGGAIINDIVFILKGLTDALITQFFWDKLGGAIIVLDMGFWGERPTIILGLTRTTNLTCSIIAAAVSYGFTLF